MKFEGFLSEYDNEFGEFLPIKVMTEVNLVSYNRVPTPIAVGKYNGFTFRIGDVEFLFRGTRVGSNDWIIKFGVHDGRGNINIDMTEKHEVKDTIKILNNVAKCLSMFTIKYEPDRVTFIADRKSRQLTYERLIATLLKEPEFQYYGFPDKRFSDTDKSVTYILKRKG
jgi:hypothetical protein